MLKPRSRMSELGASGSDGNRGCAITRGHPAVAERLQFDYFNKKLIEIIAESAHTSAKLVESVEKKRASVTFLVGRGFCDPSPTLTLRA